MRVVLIGGVQFSAIMLKQLLHLPVDVVGVCTRGPRQMASDKLDLGPIAIENGIPFKHVNDINDSENLKWIVGLKPDLICCFGWSQLLSAGLLKIPPLGVLGFHPAALPANRGRHPIIWALALGLTDTASTFFFMDDGADSGDIVSQKSVSIGGEDGAGTLYENITSTALSQFQELIPKLIDGSLLRETQDPTSVNATGSHIVLADLPSALCREFGSGLGGISSPIIWAYTPVGDVKSCPQAETCPRLADQWTVGSTRRAANQGPPTYRSGPIGELEQCPDRSFCG